MNRNPRHLRAPVAVGLIVAILVAIFGTIGSAFAQRATLLTHDSFVLPEDVIETFEGARGIDLRVLSGGDAGEIVNRALLTRARPIADALFGIDDALVAREGARELFVPYRPDGVEAVPEALRFAGDLLTPITVGFVAFNFDVAALTDRDLPTPTDLTDLTELRFAGATVVSDPATSSPGLAFLLTTVARFGEGGDYDWLDYWADLRDADVRVVSGWSDAYYTAFSRYGGDRPIVLSYATSPAAEVLFAEEPLDEAPTRNLLCDRCVWRQIEAVGVLDGAANPDGARALVDLLVSEAAQSQVATSMFVYPARSDVPLPEAFTRFAPRPTETQTARLPAADIEANQARWLEQWTQVVRQGRSPDDVR